MIRVGERVRLSAKDMEDLEVLTGLVPTGIDTVHDLEVFLQNSKARFAGADESSRTLRSVIESAGRRLLNEHTISPLTYRRNRALKLYFSLLNCADRALRKLSATV